MPRPLFRYAIRFEVSSRGRLGPSRNRKRMAVRLGSLGRMFSATSRAIIMIRDQLYHLGRVRIFLAVWFVSGGFCRLNPMLSVSKDPQLPSTGRCLRTACRGEWMGEHRFSAVRVRYNSSAT